MVYTQVKDVALLTEQMLKIGKRLVYQSMIDKLNKGKAISRIAKELDISRPTVYKIKYEYEQQHEKSNAT